MITKIFRATLSFTVLMVLGLTLAACGNSGISSSIAPDGNFVDASAPAPVGGKAAANAQKIFTQNAIPTSGTDNDDYKIAPLDVIEVSVFGVKELERTVQVSSSGMITLPLIKNVRAGGRTQAQLEKDIAAKLEAGYLQSPSVSVFVKEYNSQRITVDGAVNKPGIYQTTNKTSLLQAIALAEGLNAVADTSGILLFRTVDNKRLAARFDIKQIRSGKVADPQLQPGDIVMVDESAARTTLRDVKDALPLTGVLQLLLL